ncbi:MAG: hypothetical protein ACMUHY_07650, partial [Thermoplasmatota archaeon]
QGNLTIGEFVAFNAYILLLLDPMLRIGNFFVSRKRAQVQSERIEEIREGFDRPKDLLKEMSPFRHTIFDFFDDVKWTIEASFNSPFDSTVFRPEDRPIIDGVIEYFFEGVYTTRTGIEIKRPDINKLEDVYLDVLLDIVKIAMEKICDKLLNLPDEPPEELKEMEKKYGEVAELAAGAIARSIGSKTLGNTYGGFKITDDLIRVLEIVIGVSVRKLTEFYIERDMG